MCNEYLEEIIAYGLAFSHGEHDSDLVDLEPYRLLACQLLADEQLH